MSLSDDIRAVYFDLDDTLCGYWDASKQALRETFEKHAPEGHNADSMVSEWAAAFREFLPEIKTEKWYETYLRSGDATRLEQMRRTLLRVENEDPAHAALLSQTYHDLRNHYLKLFPDAIEVLETLHSRFPLGLITNGPADNQRMEIEVLGISEFFDHVFIEGEQGLGKPEQEVFLRAAAAVDLAPRQILFVGNSYAHDILPAIEAGWRTAWIRRESDVAPSIGGEAPKPEQLPEGKPAPDIEITELSELLDLLIAW